MQAAPAAFRVASSGDTVGSGRKRPMNETEWQEFCRGWPVWSGPVQQKYNAGKKSTIALISDFVLGAD